MRSTLTSQGSFIARSSPGTPQSGGVPTPAYGGPVAAGFAKRSSVFPGPGVGGTVIPLLQKSLFSKQHEEVIALLQVVPKPKKDDNLLSFPSSSAQSGLGPHGEEQSFFLVLTCNSQIKRSVDGFGAPKLHWVKIKPAEHAGGETTYTYKKCKLLKLLKRIDIPASGGIGSASSAASSGALGKKERDEFTLVFASGNTDKFYTFAAKAPGPATAVAPSPAASSSASAASAAAAQSNPDRSVFVWYSLEMCRIYCGFVPSSNIDTVLYQQLTQEICAFYLSDAPGHQGAALGLSPQHKELIAAVSKNRYSTLEHDAKSMDRSNIEEKVIVPSMTAEETALVQQFLRQIDGGAAAAAAAAAADASTRKGSKSGAGTPTSRSASGSISSSSTAAVSSAAAAAAAASATSNINALESFLLHKLSVIETQNIESLFDARLEAENTRILNDQIQSNLLDSKLEEMSFWINYHNAELVKMKKGIELIETRNLSLDIQEKNQTLLHTTLKQVLESLKLDAPPGSENGAEDAESSDEEGAIIRARHGQGGKPSVESLLSAPDFSSANLDATLAAAARLDHVLHLSIEGKLEDLRAVKEQRERYETLRRKFTAKARSAMETIFSDVAKRNLQELMREGAALESSLTLSTNAAAHRDLRRYAELLRYLERLELDSFLSLRSAYTSAFRLVYEQRFKSYFSGLKKSIASEAKDTRMSAFPDWSLDVVAQATRVRSEQGRSISVSSNGAIATLLRSGPNAGLPASQSGKLLATQAFVQALKNLTPLCLSEEKFLNDYFGLSRETLIQGAGATAAAAAAGTGSNPGSVASTPAHGAHAPGGSISAASTPVHHGSMSRLPRGSGVGSMLFGSLASGSSVSHLGVKSDADEIKSLMSDLFRVLEPELREVATQGSKMDHFYTLEMLVQCERIMAESTPASSPPGSPAAASAHHPPSSPSSSSASNLGSEYLSSIITSISTHLKLNFNQFVDGEIEWINGLKPNSKRCGILMPFLRFPALVDRMENVVRVQAPSIMGNSSGKSPSSSASNGGAAAAAPRSQAADTSYQKLASALFRWLDGVAKSDDKYTDVVYMENLSFFSSMFSSAFLSVPALDQFVSKAKATAQSSLLRYVDWHIQYEMPALHKFWARLEDQLRSILPEDIPFASELSKHDLRGLCKNHLTAKALHKSLGNVLKRVEKHMPKNPQMISIVWHQISLTFLAKLARFEKLVADCYSNEKIGISQEEVVEIFAQLLPAAAASAGAGAGAGRPSQSVESSRNR